MNAIEYATAVCDGQTIHDRDLPETVTQPQASRWSRQLAEPPLPAATAPPHQSPPPPPPTRAGMVPPGLSEPERAEALLILEAMRAAGFRKGKAAGLLGISRTTLWRKLKQYRIG